MTDSRCPNLAGAFAWCRGRMTFGRRSHLSGAFSRRCGRIAFRQGICLANWPSRAILNQITRDAVRVEAIFPKAVANVQTTFFRLIANWTIMATLSTIKPVRSAFLCIRLLLVRQLDGEQRETERAGDNRCRSPNAYFRNFHLSVGLTSRVSPVNELPTNSVVGQFDFNRHLAVFGGFPRRTKSLLP